MANKTLNTRIKLKYDTLANWQGAGASVVLLKGEVAVCEVPTGGSVEQVTPPAILFKVGDGVKTFAQLPWASALAADVYAWAKAATKPTYSTAEITGLTSALAGKENAGTAAGLIAALDSEAAVQSGKFITGFELVDGKVTNVQYGEPAEITIPEYTLVAGTDGSLTLKKGETAVSENIKVTGWDDLVSDIAAKYTKPSGGIPKTDLASAVQTSLGKADTALQAGALDGYATEEYVDNKVNPLTTSIGTLTTSVSDLDTRLDTAEGEIDALQAQIGGLTGAMHFIGTSTTDPKEEGGATVSGHDEFEPGDVCLFESKEYVYDGTDWQELGDESSYVLKTTTINGKALSANITLSATDVGAATTSHTHTHTAITDFDSSVNSLISAATISASKISGTLSTSNIPTLSIGKISGLQDTLDDKVDSADIAGFATTSTVSALANRVTTLEGKPGLDKVGTVTSVAVAGEADKINVSGSPITASGTISIKLGSKVLTTDDTLIFDCGSATTLVD